MYYFKKTSMDSQTSDEVCLKTDTHSVPTEIHTPCSTESQTPLTKVPAPYPTGARLWLSSTALVLTAICSVLDETILATVTPQITDHFHALSDVGWYGSAFLVTICIFQLVFGKLYSILPIKWVLLSAILIFQLGNAISGSATSSKMVIVGRAITGIGAGGDVTGIYVVIARIVPLHQRPLFMSAMGSIYGVVLICGPLLGGVIAETIGWRWCMFVNLPIGGAALIMLFFFVHERDLEAKDDQPQTRTSALPALIGAVPFGVSMVALLLALQFGGTTLPWNDSKMIALLVVFPVALIVFLGLQYWQEEQALLPLRIARQRSVASGFWYSFCVGWANGILLYYLPIWFQAVKGVDTITSGLMTIPFLTGILVSSILVGILVYRLGYYVPFMIAGTILMSIGACLLTTLKPSSGKATWASFQVLYAVGAGLGGKQPNLAAQTVLSSQETPIGLSLVLFAQVLGAAVSVSAGQNVFLGGLTRFLQEYAPFVSSQDIASSGITTLVANNPGFTSEILHAYNDALKNVFVLAAVFACLTLLGCIAMEWKSVKKVQEKTETKA